MPLFTELEGQSDHLWQCFKNSLYEFGSA